MPCKYLVCIFVLILEIVVGSVLQDNSENYFPEMRYVDDTKDPCDNFYDFSCGHFEKYNPRPKDQLMWDNYKIVQKEIDDVVTDVLRTKIRSYDAEAVKKAKDMYQACVNKNMCNVYGLQPLVNVVKLMGGWPLVTETEHCHHDWKFSWDFVGDVIAEYGLTFFVDWNIRPYFFDANINMILLARDPLTLPSYAIQDLEDFQPHLDDLETRHLVDTSPYIDYLNYIALSMKNPLKSYKSDSDIKKDVQLIVDFMGKLKSTQMRSSSNVTTSETIDNVGDLQNWSDEFSKNFTIKINWESFFNRAMQKSGAKITKDTKVYLNGVETVGNILKLVEQTSARTLQDFIVTRLMTYMAPDTTEKMWKIFNELNSELQNPVYTRSEYCMRKVISYSNIGFSYALAHEYQNYIFDIHNIDAQPNHMIDELKSAFLGLVYDNDWMDDEAREWVQVKADNMLRLIAFPDFVYNSTQIDNYYSNLQVCKYRHFDNAQSIRAFNFMKNTEQVDKPRDRNIWSQSPLSVNAYYNQQNNRIAFPSGIMNTPFYSGTLGLTDYSRIGAVIGHEITHGFDSNGRNTDANGTFTGCTWSKQVKDAFDQRKNCFIDQYSKYYIEEIQKYVDGTITITENIADNGGMREAYRVFQQLRPKYLFSNKHKYTQEQLFFIAYGTMWCRIDTVESLEKMYTDVHAPSRFRVIGTLSNMVEFSQAFHCPVGSNMNPKNKCILW